MSNKILEKKEGKIDIESYEEALNFFTKSGRLFGVSEKKIREEMKIFRAHAELGVKGLFSRIIFDFFDGYTHFKGIAVIDSSGNVTHDIEHDAHDLMEKISRESGLTYDEAEVVDDGIVRHYFGIRHETEEIDEGAQTLKGIPIN